jgi:hypothetical protein
MDDGAKKAGGIVAAIVVAIGGFSVRFLDNCASVGARSARYGDDVVSLGTRSGDDLGHLGRYGDDLGGAPRYGDDVAAGRYGVGALGEAEGAGRYGDDLAGPSSYELEGRTGGSFGGSSFDQARWADEAVELGDDAALDGDALELVADALIEAAPDAVEFMMAEDEEPHAWPARRAPFAPSSPHVVALSSSEVATAPLTVSSFAALEEAFGSEASIELVVARGEGRVVRVSNGEERSVEAVLLRAAQLGDRAVVLVCPTDRCMEDAARVASMAAELGPDDIANRLVRTRDRVAPRAGISLHRLRSSGGRLQLVSEPASR